MNYQLFEQVFKELVHLLLFKVRLDILHVVKLL